MTLKRQLLLVSLLALMLPWAGCEFIRETESALRQGQQQNLAGIARAIAGNLAQFAEEFPKADAGGDRLYLHPLENQPMVDGYVDDWALPDGALVSFRSANQAVRFAAGTYGDDVYLYVDVRDRNVVYATEPSALPENTPGYSDRLDVLSISPPYRNERYLFTAAAPGPIVGQRHDENGTAQEPAIAAYWQDVPGGYHVEARFPADYLGTHIGLSVNDTASHTESGLTDSAFDDLRAARTVGPSPELGAVAAGLSQEGLRILVTDAQGWRLAAAGDIPSETAAAESSWSRHIYDVLVESGNAAAFAEPAPNGQETQGYIGAALQGTATPAWFRSEESGRAIVAVAAPVQEGDRILGAVVVQQGTDAILSQTNAGLARLINVTLIATLVVVVALLGYSTWLSRRIRRLSVAAEDALVSERLHEALPSAQSGDEIGDLSRSFSHVLQQLGDYNDYLRTLASKLSHELRTPLAIVTSSLENLEHEPLGESSNTYVARARGGADRLRRILSAMSEASRVEELMENAEPEAFEFRAMLESTIAAYRDVYPQRTFAFDCELNSATVEGSPELLTQMLDKLVDNAADFSARGDTIRIGLTNVEHNLRLSVRNPGPPLPERMQKRMFDSMVSMRKDEDSRHLGLGLYVARLIAEGHGGTIVANNVDDGVEFAVLVPIAR